MSDQAPTNGGQSKVDADRQLIVDARTQGKGAMLGAFVKLSGPGWLQSAITLGGGSLAGALYLGVLGGYDLIWLQLLAMLMGVIMLSAISYVTLATGEKPFRAINQHINPVLGWGWAIATLMANIVWCLPQFALGTAAVQQNLAPDMLGGDGGKAITCIGLLAIAIAVIWAYDSGSKGVKIFETILKVLVGIVVICFFGVVVTLSSSEMGLPWGQIISGLLVPKLSLLFEPAESFQAVIAQTGDFQEYWTSKILTDQRNVMVTAFATAVGINMTFLLPYSMLKKGWDREFRGLAIFDLATGLLVPFVLATTCVVVASASQFHAKYDARLLSGEEGPKAGIVGQYNKNLDARLKKELGADEFGNMSAEDKAAKIAAVPEADKQLCAMLVKRDAFSLAGALEPLTGKTFAHYVFGFGVLAMAISTIIILMLISGFTFCEIFGKEPTGWPHRLGCLVAGIGVIGPYVWTGDAKFWLAVPTSTFGMCLLPIAYFTFLAMMNSKSLLGDDIPKGGKRILWNVLMITATGMATFGAFVVLSGKDIVGQSIAGGVLGVMLVLGIFFHFTKKPGGNA